MASERIPIDNGCVESLKAVPGIVFDTNVWLRVEGPLIDPAEHASRSYSWLYKRLLEDEVCVIHLPQIVAAEFVRVHLRISFEASGIQLAPRQKVHQLGEYRDWITNASDDLYHILSGCQKLSDGFEAADIDFYAQASGELSIDYNDVVLAELCKRHNFTLVTHDADYRDIDVPIVTGNARLLR